MPTTGAAVRGAFAAALIGGLLALAPLAQGRLAPRHGLDSCTRSWAGAASGSWSDPSMWSPAGVPTASDDVCITLDGTYTVTGTGSLSAASLTLGGASGTQTLLLSGTCSPGDATLTVTGAATISAPGAVSLGSTCSAGSTLSAGTISNQGAIATVVGSGGSRTIAGDLSGSGSLAIGQGTTLTGSVVSSGSVALAASLTWSGTGTTWTNQGATTIASGAALSTGGTGQTLTDATGGSIQETGSGAVAITGGTFALSGGTVSGTSPIFLTDSGLTLASASPASFSWFGTGTLTGDLAAGQLLDVHGACPSGGGPAVVNVPGNLTNSSTITLDSLGCLSPATLSAAAGTITNSGTIVAAGGGGSVRGVVGNLQNLKTIEIDAGQVLQLTGSYTQSSKGVLMTQINSQTSFGQLAATGAASLAGQLKITRLKSFQPPAGSSIPVLTAGGTSGAWTKVSGATIKGPRYFLPTYTPTGAKLVATNATFSISPTSGHAGASVTTSGTRFPPSSGVKLTFKDAHGTTTTLAPATTTSAGGFSVVRSIPAGAVRGAGTVTASSTLTGVKVSQTFTVS
jgi:hypothetical protein